MYVLFIKVKGELNMVSKYAIIRMAKEHCGDQGGLLLLIETKELSSNKQSEHGRLVSFRNSKLDGYSTGWLVCFLTSEQSSLVDASLCNLSV